MLAPTDNFDRPDPDVVVQDVAIRQIGDKAVLMLKSARPVLTGETDVTITARDADGNEFTQTIHVTVQPDPFNGSPFLSSYPQSVQTTADTPVNVQLQVTDAENDPNMLIAEQIGLSATILFDNSGDEAGVTPPGTTTFSHLGTNWTGGTVTTTTVAPLPSQGPGAYVFGPGGGQITFDVPITQARFFFVHPLGQVPFTARAFNANGVEVAAVPATRLPMPRIRATSKPSAARASPVSNSAAVMSTTSSSRHNRSRRRFKSTRIPTS